MNKACFFFFLCFTILTEAFGQDRTYIEVAGGGKFRFHYNEQYFLVDKNCEFLSRIRISGMTAEKQFLGEFTDYDVNGTVLLTGSYSDGKKNGTFKSFYSNGFLRWQGDFKENRPTGMWNYYFPDGRPKTIIDFRENGTFILESWNEKGKQVVKNGDGAFVLKDYQFGYNNLGHEALLYTGKVKGGLPNGVWLIKYLFPDGETEEFASMTFKDGIATPPAVVHFAESEAFGNAENFIGKNCTIDDQANFAEYLKNNLNLKFDFASIRVNPIPSHLEATVKVSSGGELLNVEIKTPLGREAERLLREVLSDISYWIPSQKDGIGIEDTLSITIEIIPGEDQTLTFGYPLITRALGG